MRWNNTFYYICLACNSMLLFLAFFGTQLQIPSWLQITGRMHPLMLHFPIVLLLLSIVWEMSTRGKSNPEYAGIGNALLLASAVSASFTALSGLFLSNEGGYDAPTLLLHKWSGIATSLLAFSWYVLRDRIRHTSVHTISIAALGVVLVTLAGHQGATLTHGENYLLAPVSDGKNQPAVAMEDALVFRDLVRPILQAKCMSCHNARKLKGDLNMETEASLLKGGKNGLLWDSTAEHFGLLLQRIHLPVAEKEHMPPQGKPQLTENEIRILYLWIKNGSDFTGKVVDLPENDSLKLLAAEFLKSQETEQYTFSAAGEATIRKLNNDFRVVHPLAVGAPALAVEFFGVAAFKSEFLQDLKEIREQMVELNLNKMPVQDADLKTITTFTSLRKLNLSATQITGATLSELKNLKTLRQLSLAGTSVKAADLEGLSDLPNLKVLYLWNTGVTEQEIADLQQRLPQTRLEYGFTGKDVVSKLNAAVIIGKDDVFNSSTKIMLKNFIKGAEVRYTLDGSVPDSLHSSLSTGDSISIDKTCILNTKTFLPGWISSDLATRSFFKAGITPDSVSLTFLPDPKYRGTGPNTLINNKIGDTEFKTNKWLGFRETNLECLLYFDQPTQISSVYVSALANIGSFIMPPAEIEIWGGTNKNKLVLLKTIRPEQSAKLAVSRVGYPCDFKSQKLKFLKIVVKPVKKLPMWHPQKGERGWVFVDEIFVN
ncbi:MAG TPA: hypothetical protein PLO67_20410 [Saprospiraceae bacterium]|nr:hypothetical protein [Saprospiraceae bacterium]HPI08841.1 hypothetical protein [Saprospiraceae bacterium]